MSELPSVAKTQIPKGAEATSSPQSGNPPKAAEKTNQSPLREASEVMARNNASALPKRLVVFHGGFLDEQSDHPRRMQEIWADNGVPKEQLLFLPNCYNCYKDRPSIYS